jgi:hypothetical protein
MEPTAIPGHEEARRRLLEEGARSYAEAYTAVLEYQREVQKKCREVMETYLDDYGSALGAKPRLTKKDIRSVAWPKPDEWNGNGWQLGVCIVRRSIPSIRWWEVNCCLQLEGEEFDDPGLYCWIGEWFPTRKLAADLFQEFKQLNAKVKHDGKDVWIHHSVKLEEAASFDELLQTLFEEWIALWKKVGGMKSVFKG